MATGKFKTTYVAHTLFLMHSATLKCGAQGTATGCAGAREDWGGGVKMWDTGSCSNIGLCVHSLADHYPPRSHNYQELATPAPSGIHLFSDG